MNEHSNYQYLSPTLVVVFVETTDTWGSFSFSLKYFSSFSVVFNMRTKFPGSQYTFRRLSMTRFKLMPLKIYLN